MISRFLSKTIEDKLFKGKVIVLLGARQVGKTTLLKQILTKIESESQQVFLKYANRIIQKESGKIVTYLRSMEKQCELAPSELAAQEGVKIGSIYVAVSRLRKILRSVA
jgi:ABC-type cobalamin/Fe3+-siderophores transport system ATPase subunit